MDIQLTWENPPTTIYVEAKYGSGLSTQTNQNDGSHGFPSDQLIRNIRVGLHECGYYRTNALFESEPRDFAVILLAPTTGYSLVREYRDLDRLKAAIPHSDRITWPRTPFVGEIGYRDIRAPSWPDDASPHGRNDRSSTPWSNIWLSNTRPDPTAPDCRRHRSPTNLAYAVSRGDDPQVSLACVLLRLVHNRDRLRNPAPGRSNSAAR